MAMKQDFSSTPTSNIMSLMQEKNYEHINYFYDKDSGAKAIIAIHSTTLGPALGGLRFYPYKDESSALNDVLRLSKAMSYKAAIAGLSLGGGKSVLIGNPETDKNEAVLKSFGRFVERLNGKYITSVDSGTSDEDMIAVKSETNHVTGAPPAFGGSGDPSPMTAYGVYRGILASVAFQFGSSDLTGKRIAIQGLGHVGYPLAKLLHEAGAKLIVTDINEKRIERCKQEFNAQATTLDDILTVECDVLAPCALGGIITEEIVPQLNTPIVAGAANNQLESPAISELLFEKNIVYAPDFVINAGGLINVDQERHGYDETAAKAKTHQIHDTVLTILNRSKQENQDTAKIAITMAKERIYG
ncbi:MAG TPA: Glu/Leu/Phe/Val dehydrogenase [Oligoflexia bacterium]|nr:Glu/Leu/Phe/Val dehydrogenase [Oligoflexia bacterium]HMR24430.1 Glu/Leu/Phe/Val dehydrogenase [Oligoflexia bacterium]